MPPSKLLSNLNTSPTLSQFISNVNIEGITFSQKTNENYSYFNMNQKIY